VREGEPSQTCVAAAAHRALHQTADHPVVFADPLAQRVMLPEWEAATELLGRRPIRALIVARARLTEEYLAAAVMRGVTQHVVLGAGLDTFAWRNPHPDLRVFEVDFPATQAWKRAHMAPLGLPPSLTFAPVDFERQSLVERLVEAGLDPDIPTFVAWLGVTPYLKRETVLATFQALAAMPGGVEIVFDYGLPPASFASAVRAAYDRRAADVAAVGEPWLSYFEPGELQSLLAPMGYTEIDAYDEAGLNARYFKDRDDGLRVVAGRVMRVRKP